MNKKFMPSDASVRGFSLSLEQGAWPMDVRYGPYEETNKAIPS